MKYQVDVTKIPEKSVEFTKALRVIGGMSLRDANSLHLYLSRFSGGTVIAGVEKDVAEVVARELQQAGATSVVVQSSALSPSVCNPAAAKVFSWKKVRVLSAA